MIYVGSNLTETVPGIDEGLHLGMGVVALHEALSSPKEEKANMPCVFALRANGVSGESRCGGYASCKITPSGQSTRVIKQGNWMSLA